jgi:hypothetical protein
MDDLEKRLLELETKVQAEMGGHGESGNVWRVIDSHTKRIETLDNAIWKGNGDSLVTQLVRLRTELRVAAVVLGVAIPILYSVVQHFLSTH